MQSRPPARAAARPRNLSHGDTSGQAMVEFIIGLVAILSLFAFLVQFVSLSQAHLNTMAEARRQAGRLSLAGLPTPDAPGYIRSWDEGDDHSRHTRDDHFTRANQAEFVSDYVSTIAPGPAEQAVMASMPHNPIGDLRHAAAPVDSFGLFSRREQQNVNLLPGVRDLLYHAGSIEIESEVWLTSTYGIY